MSKRGEMNIDRPNLKLNPAVFLIMGFTVVILRLKLIYALVCMIFAFLLSPFIVNYSIRASAERRRFSDICLYIEQVLYSFQKRRSLVDSMEEAGNALAEDSPLREKIYEAIDHILYDNKDESIVENGLRIIEMGYESRRLRTVHSFLINMDRYGGDPALGVSILQKDRSLWQRETEIFRNRINTYKRNTIIAMLITLAMCSFTPTVLQRNVKQIAIWDSVIYQTTAAAMIILFLILYVFIQKKVSAEYIDKDESLTEEEAVRLHRRIYGEKNDIGRRLALRQMKREVIKDFPAWFINISVQLQTNNVAAAIQNSYVSAPNSLKPAVADLIDDLALSPEAAYPYQRFLKVYEVPEISAAMGMLYAISNGGGEDERVQLEEILNRNSEITSASESLKNEDRMGGMYGIFLLPAFIGSGKMLVDMTLVLFAFLNMAG